jgi:LacI family transcriptional regulator
VLHIIEELQYKPNAVARAMVSQRTNNIGVVIYRSHPPVVSHPFYGKILDAILSTAAGLNYSVFVTTDHEMSLRSADFMMEKRVDGLILISRLQQNVIDYIKNFGVSDLEDFSNASKGTARRSMPTPSCIRSRRRLKRAIT